jgi:hypothetical protein
VERDKSFARILLAIDGSVQSQAAVNADVRLLIAERAGC